MKVVRKASSIQISVLCFSVSFPTVKINLSKGIAALVLSIPLPLLMHLKLFVRVLCFEV